LLAVVLGGQTTFTTDVRVVNLFATVRDQQGQIRHDLTKEDFKLEEDGKVQTIRYFSQQTNLPLVLGLLVDTSASMLRVLDRERETSKKFFKQVLREEDKAFLVHFDRDVELWQDLTSSRKKLDSGLGRLDSQTWFRNQMAGSSGAPGRHRASTALYDALLISSRQVLKKQPGRKAIILLSDGMDSGSQASLENAIEAAQRADTLVYSIRIYFEEPDSVVTGGPNSKRQKALVQGKEVLQRISRETGGSFFEVSAKTPLEQIYEEIEGELRNQYSLGFTPDEASATAGFHKIVLSTNHDGLAVQARNGYYVDQ
jgi:VWFA-related protein